MNLNEICNTRESVRDYATTPIESGKLAYILEAARLAPSACNRQPYRIMVLESPQARAKVGGIVTRFAWIQQAPVQILICVDHSQEWVRSLDGKHHGDIDAAIVAEHICLAATEQGLGTCWICSFDTKAVAEAFSLPENLEPVILLPLGYPGYEGQRAKTRKPLEQIVEKL